MKQENEKGQALLELIIFLPLMFTVYAIVTGFANAIFGSINQQKATRAYFYYRVQNNSTIPKPPPQGVNWTRYGSFFVGWREKIENDLPLAPCYRISIPIKNADSDNCETEYTAPSEGRASTQFMRVGTVYGVCGTTYERKNNIVFLVQNFPDPGLGYQALLDQSSCTIKE